MAMKVRDLTNSDIWLNKFIKDPDRDTYEAERGEKDKDLKHSGPGFIPKSKPKKGGRHV